MGRCRGRDLLPVLCCRVLQLRLAVRRAAPGTPGPRPGDPADVAAAGWHGALLRRALQWLHWGACSALWSALPALRGPRLQAFGAARGLLYLHMRVPPIVHHDGEQLAVTGVLSRRVGCLMASPAPTLQSNLPTCWWMSI